MSREWIAALDEAVTHAGPRVIVVAHSLACLTVAQWAAAQQPQAAVLQHVVGALLVAPPDPAGDNFPTQAQGFETISHSVLPFKSLVVLSSDDPYDQHLRGESFATQWGSRIVRLEHAGHINSDSNVGDWPAGLALLAELGFCATTTPNSNP